jgi:hypothetical protein
LFVLRTHWFFIESLTTSSQIIKDWITYQLKWCFAPTTKLRTGFITILTLDKLFEFILFWEYNKGFWV